MLGVSVVAADTDEEASVLFTSQQQAIVNLRRGRPTRLQPPRPGYDRELTPVEHLALRDMQSAAIIGSADTVKRGLSEFAERTGADELIVSTQVFDHASRVRSYEIIRP
jgi:alkanesulfonate monooxygenase SsuD/methylene tetrahydromethanopterin reductase-like flavin-dependent oxidoreductase (luciferase family)